jgi:hydroxymethylglutaryl-CoA synthase
MAGIVTYGAYIPLFRLSRAEIARAWGMSILPGERAVANYDEDSLTMALAAARDCLKGVDRKNIGGLYFASTTAPYKEKQGAAIIAAVLDLVPEAVTMDFSGSLRCGSNALKAAVDAVDNGSAQSILVCAADTRLGYPSGPNEMNFGDGAAALLVGKKRTIADCKQYSTRYYEIQDIWRSDKDIFVRSAEDRFGMEEGFINVMTEKVSAILKNSKLTTKDISHVALNSPNLRQLSVLTQKLGFDEKKQVKDVLHMSVGDTGSAMSLMSLIATLERAKNGEKILMASYGNGCDAFILETTEQIATVKDRRGIVKHLASKSMIDNYNKYLRWRELVPVQPAARPPLEFRQPSPVAQWREVPWELRLTGTKCQHCGLPQYPPQRVCVNCHTKDEFEPYNFSDRPAKVFSFSHDYIMQSVEPPVTVTFVDFEGGGRIMCDMTDREVAAVRVGMPLEMTFRRLYYVGGIYNYWWKCQPVRC